MINCYIEKAFPIDADEYAMLDRDFEKLCKYQGQQLLKRNTQNNHIEDIDDFFQELRIKMITAGSYHKRQTYISSCFVVVKKFVVDPFLLAILEHLEFLWENKTRHGANRQKFGEMQENILETIVLKCVPKEYLPDKKAKLKINQKFARYCKAITWNHQKTMGKKITRERSWRKSLVSLSEYDYLGND